MTVAVALVAAPPALRAQRDVGIRIFDDINYRGRSASIDRDVPDLVAYGFDRRVSSLRIAPGESWEVCTGRNYSGRCKIFGGVIPDLRRGGWNDEIVSIRRARPVEQGRPGYGIVPAGSLELYAGADFSGRRIVLTGPTPDFRRFNFNDRALSLRAVRGEPWEVCYNINFDDCRVVDGEVANLARFGLEHGISSARPRPRGWVLQAATSIELYAGIDYSGDRLIVRGAIADLNRDHFNDRAMSLRVPRGERWEVCVNSGFDDCRVVDHDIPNLDEIGLRRLISSIRPHRDR
jgi:hypothetical protein